MNLFILIFMTVSIVGSILVVYLETHGEVSLMKDFEDGNIITKIGLVAMYLPAWIFIMAKGIFE